jgi:hypothetical protein
MQHIVWPCDENKRNINTLGIYQQGRQPFTGNNYGKCLVTQKNPRKTPTLENTGKQRKTPTRENTEKQRRTPTRENTETPRKTPTEENNTENYHEGE